MALVVYDRVQQTGTANTTVSFTLSGSVTGYQSFSVVGNGNTTFYAATDTTGNWEVGVGTYATGGTLTRTTILSSSNSGSAVTFSGTCNVFVTYPSEKSVNLDASGNVTALGTISSAVWNGTTIPVAYGGTGVTTSTGASSVVLRDANVNVTANNFLAGYNVITAAAGTTVLTVSSAYYQRISGSTTQTIQLPIATTLVQGQGFTFDNDSSGAVYIVDSASGAIDTVPSGGYSYIFAEDVTTSAGSWGKYALLPASYDFSTTSANFGSAVISNTTYQGTAVAPGYGGTGLTTFSAANNALYSTSSSALAAGTLPIAAGGTSATTANAAFNALSPMTTAGDIIYGGTSGAGTRLGVGTTGQVLTVAGGVPTWSTNTGSSAFYTRTSFTATAGQTTFTVSYTAGQIQVYVNGVMLNGADYTATNGTSVVLAVGRATNDIVEMVAFTTGSVISTTGALVWQSVKTANFTAVSGNAYPVNTTSGAVTVTLPSSPAAGAYVTIVDYAGTAGTNAITINPNGSKIQSTTTNVTIAVNRQAYNFVYIDTTQGWISYAQEYNSAPQGYTISYLLVAGGGGGGGAFTFGNGSGGGGAGGAISSTTSLTPATVYTITVGAAGAGGIAGSAPTAATNSSITGLTASVAGGYGAYWSTAAITQPATNGGSGGGGASTTNYGTGTSGQGYNGGAGNSNAGAGGGGANATTGTGSNASSANGGNGGDGLSSSITGSAVIYATGGGGGSYSGTVGNGGSSSVNGGNGGRNTNGSAATANTGSGGGGGAPTSSASANGGNGGSGVVILSIPTANYSATYTGSPTITTSGSNTILKYTTSGTYTG